MQLSFDPLATTAGATADLTLLAYVLILLPLMIVGYFYARRRMYEPHHKWAMTIITLSNWVLILFVMVSSYEPIFRNLPDSFDNEMGYVPSTHALLGASAQLLATYLLFRMWFEDALPSFLKVKNIRFYMRLTLFLWVATAFYGFGVYATWYESEAPVSIVSSGPVRTEEPSEERPPTRDPFEDEVSEGDDESELSDAGSPARTREPSDSDADAEEGFEATRVVTAPPEGIPSGVTRGLYVIDSDQSEARYIIEEVLRGENNTVVGITKDTELGDVGADIIINFINPTGSEIGEVAINARRFQTDNETRDSTVRSRVLQTSVYEFIFFEPTDIIGLPSTPVEIGATLNFQVQGELSIRSVSRSVTFDVRVSADSYQQISGLARAEINYSDFGISFSAPSFVGEIDNRVAIELDFVAELVTSQ